MVRSHSRLPIHRPAAPESTDGRASRKAALSGDQSSESRMLKFLGSTIGIIFLIGLVVVIILLKALF